MKRNVQDLIEGKILRTWVWDRVVDPVSTHLVAAVVVVGTLSTLRAVSLVADFLEGEDSSFNFEGRLEEIPKTQLTTVIYNLDHQSHYNPLNFFL